MKYLHKLTISISFLLFAILGPAAGVFAKGQADGSVTIPLTGELRFGITSEPATLDPLSSANTADGRSVLFNVYEGLVKPDTDGNLQPACAESWTVEEGGRIYRFKMRADLLFCDGRPVQAADAAFSLNTAKEAKFSGFDRIDSIETGDDGLNLTITLKEADPEFLAYLTVGIVPAGSTNMEREHRPIGTGPFMIKNYTAQQSIELIRNPYYRQGDLPRLSRVTVAILADSDALFLGLAGGGIDAAAVTGSVADRLDPAKFELFSSPSNTIQLMALNNGAKPFDDIRVRKAVNYAIDTKGIVDTAFYGKGTISGSPLIPSLKNYYDAGLTNPYPVDTAKAKQLLAEAGYTDANRLSFEITVPSNYSMHVDTAQVIASQLAAAGIDVKIKLVDWAAWLADTYRGRKYQATIISLDSSNVSPRSFLSRYKSGGGSNFINYSSAAYDKAYDAAQTETDDAKRASLYRECQRIMSGDAASVYIQDIMNFKAFPKGRYGGVINYPLYVIDFAHIYAQ